jgi:hypothetical protein
MRIFPMLLFIACTWMIGCEGVSPALIGQDERNEPLQEAIFSQAKLQSPQEQICVTNPAWVLLEIPLGSPVDKARAVMQRHGFQCADLLTSDKRPFLSCTASKRTSWVTADSIRVEIYYQAGEVTDLKVITFRNNGP